jgi:2-polyprenyl-3-methyl-5-hydroxy-6-metoxy-1,4-benzoquinol methylase
MHTQDYGWTDTPPESSTYINPAVITLARSANARSILDAGCGNGSLSGTLAEAGFQVTGVDADQAGVALARNRFPAANFTIGSFLDPPPRQDFDMVVSTEVVEHLYSPHELADYCFSALRPGGTLVISTPYHGYLKNLALSLLGKWDKHHTALWHGGHIKFWSKSTLGLLLEKSGFEIEGFLGVGRVPLLWKSMILVAKKP